MFSFLTTESSSEDSDDDGDGNYLHPSLFAPKKCSRLEELTKPLKVMDPDHPLAAIVLKAQQERNGTAPAVAPPEEPAPAPPVQYSADPVYYGYYMLPDGSYCLAAPPPGVEASSYYNNMTSAVASAPASSEASSQSESTSTPAVTVTVAPQATAPSQVSTPAETPAVATNVPEISSSKVEAPVSTPAPAIIPPPPDIQPVIDKLAEYVARNGLKFEASVRAKKDPRFDFLQSWHQYNAYYEFKKNYFLQKEGKALPEFESTNEDKLQSDSSANDAQLNKASFAPISFAIKPKDTDMLPFEKNRVRLDDDSDEDKLLEEQGLDALMVGAVTVEKEPSPAIAPEEKKPALTLEELEAKQAKQKLEDRLAAAAREKLAQASKESKEKQLQAERKRKAALFLQTLRSPIAGEPEAKRAELESYTQQELQEAYSVLSGSSSPQVYNTPPVIAKDQRAPLEIQGGNKIRELQTSSSSSSLYSSGKSTERHRNRDRDRDRDRERARDKDREKGRDKEKKKKKHRRRSRSSSRSKSGHSLPSSYKRGRRSRSRSRSPGRRDRRAASPEKRREERDRYHHSSQSSLPRGHSRSRSPSEPKRKAFSLSGQIQTAGTSVSPYSSPRVFSHSVSPASSLGHSRGGSQEKDKAVSSSIVSSVQSKITQDLMAKVRAMLATSKTLQPPTS
uniref:Splicing factor, suppressor of white-apricot homolog n=1 Tax=Cyprinodon variegatus TaxID=28743 RepID=A0A3Q2DLD0_CYPVA